MKQAPGAFAKRPVAASKCGMGSAGNSVRRKGLTRRRILHGADSFASKRVGFSPNNGIISVKGHTMRALHLSCFLSVLVACTPLSAIGEESPVLTDHAAPKALPAGAVTADWPRFLGPADNASSPETKLLKSWPAGGPVCVWELQKGAGWSCPAIVGDRLVLFHRQEDREVIQCLDRETGKPSWDFSYTAPYQDRYGASDGPRTSPVIADGRVFAYGVAGMLHALDLTTGKVLWKRDIQTEFDQAKNFFGHGSTPLVLGKQLILSIGSKDGVCAAALDTANGATLWTAKHPWGASYASPVAATLHGRECILLFAGGESRPPTGGLLTIDAHTGEILNATPHRAPVVESVSASSPVIIGDQVFVTESYGSGGELIAIDPAFKARSVWIAEKFGCYFMTPIVLEGCLYGFDGQQPGNAELVCYEIASGKELWRDDLGGKFGRGTLLSADGAVLALGEFGDLALLALTPSGVTVKQRAKLFHAPETWALPALSHGLLYVCQNEKSSTRKPARLLCYDLRGE